eukprot:CAMPEP_0181324740 /NCGR_PEP_ID=MMETSP1101-20121128/20531_1 /TAXON_ID=46948 /ORGANISM="Rhodomonas abbreviata, Strain Caron Lab Isolate" /LENGTH=253 /DNA_ID=CAMNT_0023432957 /DNA_START=8 /DNA_END=769 /DNA_ORIENTATION=-
MSGAIYLLAMMTCVCTAHAFIPPVQPFAYCVRGMSHLTLKPEISRQYCHRRSPSRKIVGMGLADDEKETSGRKMPTVDKTMQNMADGKFGERGELYVGLQFFFIFLIIIAPAFEDTFESLSLLVGTLICSSGLGLGAVGVLDLGDSLTPWPKPTSDNELQTTGSYGLSRHPIYGGLLITCVGLSLISLSYPRLFFTFLLLLILDVKAEKEERWLSSVHPQYGEYKQEVPKFFPRDVSKMVALFKDLMGATTPW